MKAGNLQKRDWTFPTKSARYMLKTIALTSETLISVATSKRAQLLIPIHTDSLNTSSKKDANIARGSRTHLVIGDAHARARVLRRSLRMQVFDDGSCNIEQQ